MSCSDTCYKDGKGCTLTVSGICVFELEYIRKANHQGKDYYNPLKDEHKIRQERIKKIVSERKPLRPPLKRIS